MTLVKRRISNLPDFNWGFKFPSSFDFRDWKPFIDIFETDEEIKVLADVGEIDPKNLTVDLSRRVLTLSGWVKKEKKEGFFSRSLSLPVEVHKDKAKATFQNGVLKISLPKTEETKEKEISIEFK